MLNRLYIVVGILAILVLGAGFVVPRLMDWDDYRARIEALAEANLGTDVIIGGKIEFTLLPQPKFRFGKTFIGAAFSPALEIDSIEAEFSLMDFLRDQFVITKLVLQSPKVNLVIDESGQFELPFEFPEIFETGNLSVADAQVLNGSIELFDERRDQRWVYKNFNGELSASGLRGPFGLKGTGEYLDDPYAIRLNLSGINGENQSQASFFVRPVSGQYSLAAGGVMTFGEVHGFLGNAVLRSSALISENAETVRGDLVVSSEIDITADKILFSAFEIQPDENQAGSRLSGAAVVNLGKNANFNAVISGGVVGYALKDILAESPANSYPLLDFFAQFPAPYVPQIPGRIGVDVAELNVHDVALRNVRLDATSDGETWFFEKFQANFAGSSQINFSGSVAQNAGKLMFDGQVGLQSNRLGALARLWRDVDAASTLHNSAGSVSADVRLSDAEISVENGTLEIDGIVHGFDGRALLSDMRSLDARVRFAPMGDKQSERLLSLLPNFSVNSDFKQIFAQGKIGLTAEQIFVFGMQANSLVFDASWNAAGLHVAQFSAGDFGGTQFSVTGDLDDLNGMPQITGAGRLTLGKGAKNGILAQLGNQFGVDLRLEGALAQSLPIDVNFDLGPVDESTHQLLSVEGRAGVSDVFFSMGFENPLLPERGDFVDLSASMTATDGVGLAAQIGLGQRAYFGSGEPTEIQLSANGSLSKQIQTEIMVQAGEEYVGYAGFVDFSDPTLVSGLGKLSVSLADFSAIEEYAGVKALYIPGGRGSADFEFDSSGSYKFENLNFIGKTQNEPVTGQLRLTKSDGQSTLVGQLNTGLIDVPAIFSTILGPAALIEGDGLWPQGPLDVGSRTEKSRGRIEVVSPKIVLGQHGIVSAASFDLVWDASSISLENITGGSGTGRLQADVRICCSAPDAQKQVRARVALTEVSLSDFVSAGVGENLSGVLSAGVIFNGSGATVADLVNSLTGEGSFSLEYAILNQMDPEAFSSLVSLSDIAEYDAQALAALVGIALDQGSFETDTISGVFQLAGGKVRAENIAATNDAARLLADIKIDLADLSLGGGWTLWPIALDDPTGHVDQNSAQIAANLMGSLLAPERVLDLGQMVEAIKLRSLEIELDELEKLRAEQVTRSAEMAANRARLMELEAQRKQEEAARIAAEEEHLRQKQEAAQAAALLETGQNPFTFDLSFQDPLFLQEQLLFSDPLAIDGGATDLPVE